MADEPVDVRWHPQAVSREERERLAGHRGGVVWFTGLSGCGKSTVANLVDQRLHARGVRSFVLDGDNVRHGLCASPALLRDRLGAANAERFGLGFGPDDRSENIRRVGAVAELLVEAGIVVLTAFVSPYRRDREAVRELFAPGDFVEVFVKASVEVCEARDPKGLYRKARAGLLKGFTGIDDPYEEPLSAELVLDSAAVPADVLAGAVVDRLADLGMIPRAVC
ncbi:MAG: adenylyl-sulfate kinase [Planctomycetota bacterium]